MPSARNLLLDLFSSIADLRPKFSSNTDERSIEMLATDLLSGNDETSIQRIGSLILGKYQDLDDTAKHAFFTFLNNQMDLDIEAIKMGIENYQQTRNARHLKSLMQSAEPRRQDLLRRLNQVAGGTQVLVGMRADLLRLAKNDQNLRIADIDFAHLFTSWFNRGFLILKPISWQSPANILGKIIQYEAVHAINDWDDLRRRLQPQDRRCFAFFHPAMPDEPLVFVEVALCKGVPNSIQTVLAERDDALILDEVDTAAFYSISNCQRGLQGISFGNALIKQVVTDLSKEIPALKNFVTLSPLPGFAQWLQENQEQLPQDQLTALEKAAQSTIAFGDKTELEKYDVNLKALAAKYLIEAKRPDGQPVDAVARFHLRNGALVDALHGCADISKNGIENSFGVMVNYRYEPAQVPKRHENYVRENIVEASRQVTQLSATKPSAYYTAE